MEREPAAAIDLERLYMDEAAQYELLTAEQEVILAQTIERGRDAWNLALDEGRELSPEETEQFLTGLQARDTFITANLLLVAHFARPYMKLRPPGEERLEVIQLGNEGLEHAVEKFDWRRGFKFSTYARFWIKQKVTRGLKSQKHMACPDGLMGKFNLLQFYEDLYKDDDATILQESGWTKEKLEQLRTYRFRDGAVSSLDRALDGSEDESSGYDILPDETAEMVYENADAAAALQDVLAIARKMLSASDYKTYIAILENDAQISPATNLPEKLGKTALQITALRRQVKAVLSHPSVGIAVNRDSSLDWQFDGNCQNVDSEVFFPTRGETIKQAEKFCDDCPVKVQCLDFAITRSFKVGVWGGTSARSRRDLTKAKKLKSALSAEVSVE